MFVRDIMQRRTALPPRAPVTKFDWKRLAAQVREARLTASPRVELRQADDWRRLRPISRLRTVVRLVLANIAWLGEAAPEAEAALGPLSAEARAVLKRPAHTRSAAEKGLLHRVVGRLNCFRRYPEHARRQLAELSYYVYYEPGRVIVRQGDVADALYYVLSGEVRVTFTQWDDIKNEMVQQDLEPYRAGEMFGEMALLHDIPRRTTVVTASPCELLYVERGDFSRVVAATLQPGWDENQRAMALFPYFADWDDMTVRECSMVSLKRRYRADELVLGDDAGQPEHAHFVVDGECRLVQHLDAPGQRPRKVFMQVCLLRKGAVFNLGESMDRRRVVASHEASCLLVPLRWLLDLSSQVWTEMRQMLEHTTPSRRRVDAAFYQHRRWLGYRRRVVEQAIAGRRLPLLASLHDVPYSIRMHSPDFIQR